jgi:hypothetical protein
VSGQTRRMPKHITIADEEPCIAVLRTAASRGGILQINAFSTNPRNTRFVNLVRRARTLKWLTPAGQRNYGKRFYRLTPEGRKAIAAFNRSRNDSQIGGAK